jgi:hypothetical protein
MLTVLCVALRLILALIGVRLLPFLLAIVVAASYRLDDRYYRCRGLAEHHSSDRTFNRPAA